MGDPSAALIIETLGGFTQDRYYQAAVVALLTYEQIASLTDEIKYDMWSLRQRRWLFLFNRLNMFAIWASFILGSWSQQSLLRYPNLYAVQNALLTEAMHSCRAVLALYNITTVASLVIWAGFTTLRVHVVSHSHRHRCSRWAAALGALLGLGPFAVNLYAIVVYRSSTQLLPLGGSVFCVTENLMPYATSTRYVALSFIGRSFTIASDAVALLVIWCCIPEGFQFTRSLSWSTKLTAFLWVNGTSTFAFLLLLNVLDLVLDATLVAYGTNGPVFNPFPTLITPITTITILRFTIHLRKVATASQGTQHAATQHAPTVISAPSITPAQRSYGSVIRWIPSGSMQAEWRAPASFGAVAPVQDPELGTRPEETSPV